MICGLLLLLVFLHLQLLQLLRDLLLLLALALRLAAGLFLLLLRKFLAREFRVVNLSVAEGRLELRGLCQVERERDPSRLVCLPKLPDVKVMG